MLQTTQGAILGPSAIARYVASQGRVPELYPPASRQTLTRTQIDTWVEFALGARMMLAWATEPLLGLRKFDKQLHEVVMGQVMALVKGLDLHLQSHTLLVGAHISLADVVVAAELLDFYTLVGHCAIPLLLGLYRSHQCMLSAQHALEVCKAAAVLCYFDMECHPSCSTMLP